MAVVGWISAAPAILVALVLLLGPGLVVLAPLRMGIVARMALAGPLSMVAIGAAGIVFAPLGLAFAVWQPVVLSLAGTLLVLLLRRRLATPPVVAVALWPTVVTWLASALVIGLIAFALVTPESGQPDV